MSHSTGTISPLRQRMIDDMTQRRLKPGTQRSHILGVRRLAGYLQRSGVGERGGPAPLSTASGDDRLIGRHDQLHDRRAALFLQGHAR